MITKEEFTKIIKFMTPAAGVLVLGHGHIVKMQLLVHTGAWIRYIKYIVIMPKLGSTKMYNIMTPRTGVLVPRRGHISHIVKMHNLLQHIDCYCFKGLRCCFPLPLLILFIIWLDGAVDMYIWTLLTKSQFRVSDAQVTIKTCEPLVFY